MNNYEEVKGDPLKARVYTLDNGLRVYLTSYSDAPRIQTNIAVRAGSKHDPSDATGLAHYLEHMLFKGTDVFGSLDYEKEAPLLERIEALYEEYRDVDMEDKGTVVYRILESMGLLDKYNRIERAKFWLRYCKVVYDQLSVHKGTASDGIKKDMKKGIVVDKIDL